MSPKWDTQWNKINMRACWIALGALAVLVGVRQLEPRKVVMLGISMSSFQRQELGQERQLRDRERLSRAGSMSMGTGLLHVAPHRLTLHCARAARVLRSLRKTSVPALAESERCSRVSYEGLLLKIRIPLASLPPACALTAPFLACAWLVCAAGRPVLRDLALDGPPPRRAASALPIERTLENGAVISWAPRRHYTNTWRMGTQRVFPPARGRRESDVLRRESDVHRGSSGAFPGQQRTWAWDVYGRSSGPFQGQQQVNLDENDKQKRYWAAAGVRGAALGEVPAAQVPQRTRETQSPMRPVVLFRVVLPPPRFVRAHLLTMDDTRTHAQIDHYVEEATAL